MDGSPIPRQTCVLSWGQYAKTSSRSHRAVFVRPRACSLLDARGRPGAIPVTFSHAVGVHNAVHESQPRT